MQSSAYQQVLNEIAELLIYSASSINIEEAEELSCVEFDYYKNIFKQKFEKELENKNEFIKNTFEFAKKAVEIICKTIANVWGGGMGGLNTPNNGKK
jgi:hypothetical protein